VTVASDKGTSRSSVKTNVGVTKVKVGVPKKSEEASTSKSTKKEFGDGCKGKDDDKSLMNCIKNCAYYESSVGKKEARRREIDHEITKLCDAVDKLEVEQDELCEQIKVLEVKSPDLSLMEVREVSFLNYSLNKKLWEREDMNKQIGRLRRENDKVAKQIDEAADLYKSYVYKRAELFRKYRMKNMKN